MTITTETFRCAETMLTAAALDSVDGLITIIGLAMDAMAPTPEPDDVRVAEPTLVSMVALADRLGWPLPEASDLLDRLNADALVDLGFPLGHLVLAEHADDEVPASTARAQVMISATLAAVVRGTALVPVSYDDPRSMSVDAASRAMVALIARLVDAGGGLLYREPETANERVPDLMAVAATIAASASIIGEVSVHDRSDAGRASISSTAALISAVIHGASVMITTEDLLDSSEDGTVGYDDEFEDQPAKPRGWRSLTPDGQRLARLLPHAPLVCLVPIRSDTTLAPSEASCFVTAIGPLRRDRDAAKRKMKEIAGARLSDVVADRFVDLWDGHPERARVCLDTVGRLIGAKSPTPSKSKHVATDIEPRSKTTVVFSTVAEAMLVGMAPHVWAPMAPQPKAIPTTFHRQLFVSEPSADLLFSERMRDEQGIRLMLFGPPGTGKSAAAAFVASSVLEMTTYDVKMSDVLHYRLGALEKAIAKAFRSARERNAVLILDEADSIAQDRATASPGAVHLVTATTNSVLLELDRHTHPVILCCNFPDRLDPAIKRRFDIAYEVLPISEDLEVRALKLLLDIVPPNDFAGFDGQSVISDYVVAKRTSRLLGGGDKAAIEAVRRARDVRLGHHGRERARIGF